MTQDVTSMLCKLPRRLLGLFWIVLASLAIACQSSDGGTSPTNGSGGSSGGGGTGGNTTGKAEYKKVTAGQRHSCGLKTDGTVVCWG
jgi:hypothetical protein